MFYLAARGIWALIKPTFGNTRLVAPHRHTPALLLILSTDSWLLALDPLDFGFRLLTLFLLYGL